MGLYNFNLRINVMEYENKHINFGNTFWDGKTNLHFIRQVEGDYKKASVIIRESNF